MNNDDDTSRLDSIVDLIVQLASGDLNARVEPSPARDAIDAVTIGINLLADELQDVYMQLEQRVADRTAALLQAQSDLRRLALSDPLTGLANRTLLGDRIEQAIARADQGGLPRRCSCWTWMDSRRSTTVLVMLPAMPCWPKWHVDC